MEDVRSRIHGRQANTHRNEATDASRHPRRKSSVVVLTEFGNSLRSSCSLLLSLEIRCIRLVRCLVSHELRL